MSSQMLFITMENSNTVCSICYQSYDATVRKPLVLPCSHSFCKVCLDTIAQTNDKTCAYCRQSWSNKRVCDLLCCVQLIPSVNINLDNTIWKCKEHGAAFTMWCNSCAQPICLNCLRLKHKSCDWVLVEEKFEGAVTRLQEVFTKKMEALASMDSVIRTLLKARADLAEWKVKVEKELHGCPTTLEAIRAMYPNTAELQQKTLTLVGMNMTPGVSDNSPTLKFLPKTNGGSPCLTVVKKVAIGINLGLKHSRVSTISCDGKVEIIPNEDGCKDTPNYIAFTDHEVLVGEAAREQARRDPKNTVYDIPRFLGCNPNSALTQNELKLLPFAAFEHNGTTQIKVQYKKQKKIFTAQRVASHLLKSLKSAAEEYLGCEVTDAVITVPAGFNQSQLDAVKVAGMMAGLNVLNVVDEAACAVIAYGLEKSNPGTSSNVLVYSFGGTSVNASIFSVTNGVCVLKASNDNRSLGGDLFTKRLLDHCTRMVIDRFSNDLSSHPDSLERLRRTCEAAKRKLSRSPKANVVIEEVSPGHDFTTCFNRTQFEDLCSELFQQILDPVTVVLNELGLGREAVNEIILVGGGTLMPRVQDELKAFFGERELSKSVHPSEVGAFGAAVKAEAECRDKSIITLYQ